MSTKLSALLLCDFYKISHREQYPEGTETVYSTWTPRESRISSIDHVVSFGLQGFIKEYLVDFFNEHFFRRPKSEVVWEYARVIKHTLGHETPYTKHIEDLHDLGYLPLEIKSVAEGTLVPIRVPMLTIKNTDPRFFWLTNYIETLASCELWQACTSATLAFQYRKILAKYAEETGGNPDMVGFQGHDFSMRGMSSLHSSMLSGIAHLLSFVGTDTIPAIYRAEKYYNANIETDLVGTSIPATEHSVMCANGRSEEEVFRRLLTKVYPTGFVSIVSDTWDFWNIVSVVLPKIKDLVIARDGKMVIRPDSGDPVKIICGDPDATNEYARKGLVECLWDIFGGTYNAKGYRELDPHVGAIYGDSINLERCERICQLLKEKGFASTNMVYGIGSLTYQLNTRDTFGFALKSTACVVDGTEYQLFKAPKTDNGVKTSQKGCVAVINDGQRLVCKEGLKLDDQIPGDLLRPVFRDGTLLVDEHLSAIRRRLMEQLT
jgi:nicotinamide phosphoribosyltransferase